MKNVISYCGLICVGCPIYWATHEEDESFKKKLKIEIAHLSNKLYKTDFTVTDITDCDGCLEQQGRLFPGCVNCHIRNCASEKNIPNCAYCEDYICTELETFFKENPESKIRLEIIRSALDMNA